MRAIFRRHHCAALAEPTCRLPGQVSERDEIRSLLLELDDDLPPTSFPATQVLWLSLHRHWSAEFRTSLWFPHRYNGFRVDEIYLRYGKSKKEIRSFGNLIPPVDDEPPDLAGFPAHVHLAVGLCADGFFFQLALGPRAFPDHNHATALLAGTTACELFQAIQALGRAGYCLWWAALGEAQRRATEFKGPAELGQYLSDPHNAVRGRDWFVIRKDIEIGEDLAVSTEDIEAELRHLFPTFDLIALRRPVA